MQFNRNIAIFDLDGTIALISHRRQYVEGKKKDFDKFDSLCHLDEPNIPVINVLLSLQKVGYEIWVVSGRSDITRTMTETWLSDNCLQPSKVLMRKHGDYTPDDKLKESWLLGGIIPKDRVAFSFDDRNRVVDMWRRNGITCFQVEYGDF